VASRKQRFQEFLRRLEISPPAASLGEARTLIDATLNAVEDEMSGVPYNPTTWLTDGRMYPVQDDNIRDVPGQPNVKRARSKDHNVYIAKNGAIRIVQISTNEVALDKPGQDGNHITAGIP
jgi:uncharacterized protein YPO0396